MNNELIEFKKHLAKLFEKHGISFLNAIDKAAYIGFTPDEKNENNIKDHFTFSYNQMGDANTIPLAYDDEELRRIMGISQHRGYYINNFIEDAKPMFKYFGVKSISSSEGGLYSLRWDDGNSFVMENVDLEVTGQLV